MKIRTKGEREMGVRVRKREGGKKARGKGLAKRRRGPAPGMCLGPRNLGIRPYRMLNAIHYRPTSQPAGN